MLENPNSTIDRVKNQLTYKIGEAIIKRDAAGGGGYP
ncbi:sugar transferase [Helicobacter burdigaliensis]|nr:sugar transferase [Helicobacter burdigaliensis]